MITLNKIKHSAAEFTEGCHGNYTSEEAAISPEYNGMKIYDAPIFACGCANDELYGKFKAPDVIGTNFMTPTEWLPNAKTVISFFLPYTETIRLANARDYQWPADEWLHGRYEGQLFLLSLADYIKQLLQEEGFESLIPAVDPRFGSKKADAKSKIKFTSNWSERHVAYACGLGTFGLSKGLITEKGMCGRFGSIITELDLPKDTRPYQEVYEYCTMCGICIPHCPAQAISFAEGKDSLQCSAFIDKVHQHCTPRYGCGKCQVNVPCESKRPAMQKATKEV